VVWLSGASTSNVTGEWYAAEVITKRPAIARGRFDHAWLGAFRALTALTLVLVAAVAEAQPRPEVAAATAVVMGQLEAFRQGHFDTAYSLASETIHDLFDRSTFEAMVRGGYPEIARSSSAVVIEGDVGPDGHVYLKLTILGANGHSVDAIYELVREGAAWRINGVVARPTTGTV